jgi:PAS domain S-box-containing protein
VQHQVTVLQWNSPKPISTSKTAARLPAFISKAARSDKSRQLWIARQQAQRVARVGSWIWNAETDVVTASDELYRIYGLDPRTQAFPRFGEQRGRLFPPESWERIEAAARGTLETGMGFDLDVTAYRGGAMIWTARKGEALRAPDGRVIGVVGTVQDITERRAAEEALRESEERVRQAAEAGQIGLFDWDLRTGELRWDKRLRAIRSSGGYAGVGGDFVRGRASR